MTMNRDRPRASIITNRNISSPPPPQQDTATAPELSFLPSVEESLQTWLNTSSPEAAHSFVGRLLEAPCSCCGQVGCEAFEAFGNAIKQLEEDARLAAEIGQGLLHKHESFVLESNAMKNELEQRVEQTYSQLRTVEQILSESDMSNRLLQEQQARTSWDLVKAQKAMKDIENSLIASNTRCMELANELKKKTQEVESLRIVKLMAKQADTREETLRGKLEDTNQELAVSRKNEFALESRLKKLKTRYECLANDHERLKRDHIDRGLSVEDKLHMEWLKESNAKLQKLTTNLLYPSSEQANLHQSEMMVLIQELVATNDRLKEDLQEYNSYPADRFPPLIGQAVDAGEQLNDKENISPLQAPPSWISTSAPPTDDVGIHARLLDEQKTNLLIRDQDNNNSPSNTLGADPPSPTPSASLPTSKPDVVHHHYHYYLKRQHMHEKAQAAAALTAGDSGNPINQSSDEGMSLDGRPEKAESELLEEEESAAHSPPLTITISPTSSLKTSCSKRVIGLCGTKGDAAGAVFRTPYDQLQNCISQMLQRLKATDIRALNRRLRRAFDILELSHMSNSIIETILLEIGSLPDQFMWLQAGSMNEEATWSGEPNLEAFRPIVQLSQDMLTEIGQLRSTMNDLQAEYVRKVKESEENTEQAILRKRKENSRKRSPPSSPDSRAVPIGAFAWFSSIFQRAPTQSGQQEHLKKQPRILVRTTSVESIPTVVAKDQTLHSSTNHIKATTTTALIQTIRRKKSDIDRHGPPSSFPRTTSDKRRQRPGLPLPKSIAVPSLKVPHSAGSALRSYSMQAPRVEGASRRKRSMLCGTPPSADYFSTKSSGADLSIEWDGGSAAFGSSWLGNSSFPAGMERIDP